MSINKSYLIILLLLTLAFSNCVVNHVGNAGQNIPPLGTNYKILSVAQGKASSTRFLGIETRDRDALTGEAMQNMILRYPLSKGQTYGFLNVDSRNSSGFFYNKTTITITSFLIETADSMEINSKEIFEVFNNQKRMSDSRKFPVGSRVYFIENDQINEGLVKQHIIANGQAWIFFVSASGSKMVMRKFDELYPTAANLNEAMKSKDLRFAPLRDSILRAEELKLLKNKQKTLKTSDDISIGDKVYFQTSKGKTLGEVVKIDGDSFLIRYNERKGVIKDELILRSRVILAND
jgi:hypothetical protein